MHRKLSGDPHRFGPHRMTTQRGKASRAGDMGQEAAGGRIMKLRHTLADSPKESKSILTTLAVSPEPCRSSTGGG